MLQVQPVDELHTAQVEPELAGQATHAAADVAASVAEYEPDPQSVHAAEPVEALYVPAAQAIHGPPLGPVKPTAHSTLTIHAELDVLPTGEVVPAGHVVHDALPLEVLYVPAAHAVHVFPIGHVVSVMSRPCVMASVISVVATVLSHSSTKKKPAMSPFKFDDLSVCLLANCIPSIVLSFQFLPII
jgi:hypothetical protein